ncbi:MAG: OmpA family protein, partial [Saprospiraceae bacterium]
MSFESKLKCLAFLLALPLLAAAQKDAPILLVNPSFEDLPRTGLQPNGWTNCGPGSETPPDVQPGQFGVTLAPSNGQSYLGLVVRDNETWEMVGQRLSRPLEANQCYEFSLDLCRSLEYMSPTKSSPEKASYATPARLIIWGGNSPCEKGEPLFETSIIQNSRWLTTNCRLSPKKGSWSYIMLEAYYKTPLLF